MSECMKIFDYFFILFQKRITHYNNSPTDLSMHVFREFIGLLQTENILSSRCEWPQARPEEPRAYKETTRDLDI